MIDRYGVVSRHNPVYTEFDAPLSVGNGNFAFTADVTGLQCFPEFYEKNFDTPLCTMAHWAVHTETPGRFDFNDFKPTNVKSGDRIFEAPLSPDGQEECFNWLRQNPHKLNLCRISFLLRGTKLRTGDILGIKQELNLWEGILYSEFLLNGQSVSVKVCCHPDADSVGISIKSGLIKDNSLCVELAFPYGSHEKNASNWGMSESHETSVVRSGKNALLLRLLDGDKYFCALNGANIKRTGKHSFVLEPDNDTLEFTCTFGAEKINASADYITTEELCKRSMAEYWKRGGFIDFTACKDSRAEELSRRVILSQYLTRIQCSGNYLPQETGLLCNSWYGKAHLEMHYWHSFHFILFEKPQYFENSLWWYKYILKAARGIAKKQGFSGARWPKMPWPDGKESPSAIAPLLIWQQPHPIYYAYALTRLYEQKGDDEKARAILSEYKDVVYETADFMASFAYYDAENDRYVLTGLIPAQENHAHAETLNPAFELEYWHFGLSRAIQWAEKLGDPPRKSWIDVRDKLSALPQADGVYIAHENCPDTYSKYNKDHPSFLYALGMLPGDLVSFEIMDASLRKTLESWDYSELWGWDFPAMAMTAVKLKNAELAVQCLLADAQKNTYTSNGHNAQKPRTDLPAYLPGNGGLLTAVATMCSEDGFPKDGKWNVKYENIISL